MTRVEAIRRRVDRRGAIFFAVLRQSGAAADAETVFPVTPRKNTKNDSLSATKTGSKGAFAAD